MMSINWKGSPKYRIPRWIRDTNLKPSGYIMLMHSTAYLLFAESWPNQYCHDPLLMLLICYLTILWSLDEDKATFRLLTVETGFNSPCKYVQLYLLIGTKPKSSRPNNRNSYNNQCLFHPLQCSSLLCISSLLLQSSQAFLSPFLHQPFNFVIAIPLPSCFHKLVTVRTIAMKFSINYYLFH